MEEMAIPDGVCVRITFESAVATFLSRLAEQLQTNAEGVFFIQKDPLTQLDCRPFHIKLISSTGLTDISYQTISVILRDVGLLCKDTQGHILPICVIDNDGLVSLKISSSDCLLIGKRISRLLFDANGWCPDYEVSLLVSIGEFHGPHKSAFEAWLNGELKSNSSAFPSFHAEFLELSQSCDNCLQEPIRLSRRHSPTDTRFLIRDKENLPNHGFRGRSNDPAPESEKSPKEFNRVRILAFTASTTTKMRGAGIIKAMSNKTPEAHSKIRRYSITPIEIGQWHFGCKTIMGMLDEMLLTFGPKEFLNSLDSVATLYDANSSSSALLPQLGKGKGRSLLLTRITDLHVEVKKVFDDNRLLSSDEGSDIDGAIVPLHIGGHTDKKIEKDVKIDGAMNPSKVDRYFNEQLSFLPTVSQAYVNSRIQVTKRVLIALHLNSDPISALGLQPYDGRKKFYLPIGWIDVKDSSYRNGSGSTSDRGRFLNNSRRTVPSFQTSSQGQCNIYSDRCDGKLNEYTAQQRSGNDGNHNSENVGNTATKDHQINQGQTPGQRQGETVVKKPPNDGSRSAVIKYPSRSAHGVFHVGDWVCPGCKALVYSFRPDCYRCCTLRPDTGPHIVPRQPRKTALRPEGDVRDGDWNCLSCSGHNFADKLACFTCLKPKPPAVMEDLNLLEGLQRTDSDAHTTVGKDGEEGTEGSSEGIKFSQIVGKSVRHMPGDWICPSCDKIVFAKRYRCYKCSTLRPR